MNHIELPLSSWRLLKGRIYLYCCFDGSDPDEKKNFDERPDKEIRQSGEFSGKLPLSILLGEALISRKLFPGLRTFPGCESNEYHCYRKIERQLLQYWSISILPERKDRSMALICEHKNLKYLSELFFPRRRISE